MVPFQNPGGQNQDHNGILGMETTVETMNYTQRLSKAYSDFKENHDLHELRSQEQTASSSWKFFNLSLNFQIKCF